MIEPRRWILPKLERDAEEAEALFREERLSEPLNQYSEFFERFAVVFRGLVDRLPVLAHADDSAETIIEIFSEEDARTALRYLTAPPVSEDDLKTLAETKLSATELRRTPVASPPSSSASSIPTASPGSPRAACRQAMKSNAPSLLPPLS